MQLAAHESDRRAVLARITPAGKRVARRATKRLNDPGFGTEPLDTSQCEQAYALLEPLRRAASDFE